MRRQLDQAMDHLITLHQIEEEKTPEILFGKAVWTGIFFSGILLLVMGFFQFAPVSVVTSAAVGNRELPIYCVEREDAVIALTFDAAWGNEDTAQILEILQRQEVRATFFMTGGWVENYPEDVKAILAAGHDLGNHSENHLNMSRLSDTEKKEEIVDVHKKVKELTDYEMFLFRPPYGDYDNAVIQTAESCGYYGIQWDVDSLDWKDYGTDSIIQTVTEHKHLGNGSIILCHNGARYTADALEEMIIKLKEKGFSFLPVSELIYREDYHMDQEGRQIQNAQIFLGEQ